MNFINENDYQLSSESENPDEKCVDCECLMNAKGMTFCYAYEQELFNNKLEFHPELNYNCKLFSGNADYYERTGFEPPDDIGYGMGIIYYEEALSKGIDPKTDSAYQNALKENNDYYEEQRIDKEIRMKMNKIDDYEFEGLEHVLENASKEEKSKILEKLKEKEQAEDENDDDWDDPNSYANCSDWEDEPDNCFNCADDECPMNKS